MTGSENIRYDRQERIQNWDQKKLANAKVAIFGTGQLAQFTAASIISLGIGNVNIYKEKNNQEKGFLDSLNKEEKVNGLEKSLNDMNPDVNVKVVKIDDYTTFSLKEKPDIILDLTNSSDIKERVLEYGSRNKINTISASTGKTEGELYFVKPNEKEDEAILTKYDGQSQGAFISEVLGGMITEEVRKILMPIRKGEEPIKNLAYSSTAEERFSKEGDFEAQPYEDLSQKRILIVGAGALGNFVALGAALEGIGKIDILDYDEVDQTNLNRQIMFYDSVGKEKSLALAEKIKQINPNIEVRGLVGKLDENTTYFSENKPDLILDCVDSFATRAITNYFGVHYGIPLVSGGTNSSSGQVVVYEPEQSSCLECKLGVESALGMALQGSKCTDTPDPSVIMTNEVIGGMMVGESLKVLDKGYGAPVSRILKYDSTIPVRGGLIGGDDICNCSRGDINEWLQEVKDRFSFKKEAEK